MADFEVFEGADWIASIAFGEQGERWRLDDYDLYMDVVPRGSEVAQLSLALGSGLTITNPVARVLEINVPRQTMSGLDRGDYDFDFLFTNHTTGVTDRSEPFSLLIRAGISKGA